MYLFIVIVCFSNNIYCLCIIIIYSTDFCFNSKFENKSIFVPLLIFILYNGIGEYV